VPHDQNARRADGRYIPTQEAADRAAAAARLKAENPRMTYQQIADAVGYHDKAGAWRAINRCREAVIREAGAELITAEAAHLDDLFVSALEVLERDHVVVSHGRVVTGTDGNPLLDDGPKLAAIREMRMLRESFRKLYGLDQPAKVEHSGGVKYEVVGVDPQDVV
jgi:AraC-like DNA-binding protein